jgi:hypothetical protein
MRKAAEEYARRAERDVKAGKLRLAKAISDSKLEAELLEILTKFGLRHVGKTGKRVAGQLGGEWVIRPGLIDEILATKEVRVQGIMAETRKLVREQLRRVIEVAGQRERRPSVGELAKMIRRATKNTFAFTPERAALIARTESVQIENTANFESIKAVGGRTKTWLARRDGKSGDRHHERMHGKTIPVDEPFTTPLGNELMYPGDPNAPIKETANCRCSIAIGRRPKR